MMESFFSLFDPSDGGGQNKPTKKKQRNEQDNVKKKVEPPKGRRRGRKLQGKNETLPEESSFLCEPDLSTELLVKDCSYIENYIEVNIREEDKKLRRRNSGRKNRRKKSKVSPAKDLVPNDAWYPNGNENIAMLDTNTWNNLTAVHKISDDNIGKNVNDLKGTNSNAISTDTEREFHIDAKKKNVFSERDVYNVIDKLEKVSLKDDMYLAGDINTDDLENDFLLYSSDDLDESFGDTTSDPDDSEDEVYGSLPPEPRFGNVEYKLQLVSPCERRFQHLVTQLKWRLRSGGGTAVYVLGVRDCGALCGVRARALRGSLHTLRRMAGALHATLAHVTARRVAPHRAVAEVYLRKLADTQQSVELRMAVMGANEAGKSTLIGVLTQGELDNGRGSARLNMFRHLHEVKSGRTSSLSHEILGFDAQGNVVNYGCSELMTAERIGERSAKLVSFIDLAGHSKYQRTTLHGLTGYSPHYAMLVISVTAGITPITEEHIGVLSALDLPYFIVLTKCELAPTAVPALMTRLAALLATADKKPLLIEDENMARNCVAPHKLILDTIDKAEEGNHNILREQCVPTSTSAGACVPVFPVSCVRGAGLRALHAYLLALRPPAAPHQPATTKETCEFQIDEIFHVGESTGPVVGGLLVRGHLVEGATLIAGPLDTGDFVEISVKTIYRNRVPCGLVKAGQSASLGLSHYPPNLRPGMVLLQVPDNYKRNDNVRPMFGGCQPGKCKRRDEISKLVNAKQESLRSDTKHRKNERRKNKNLLHDIDKIECRLEKSIDNIEGGNIYRSDSDVESTEKGMLFKIEKDGDSGVCTCDDQIYLEDPNNPRGCMFFQAWVQVLRHATAISCGFQCTIHVGNVRQTATIEGIMCRNNELRAGSVGSVVFRFARCPEYLATGRRMLLTAGLGTRAIGRVTQVFPYVP